MSTFTDEFPGPTPQLIVADPEAAIAFYQRAFGADELVRTQAPDGRIMHCELLVFHGRLLVTSDFDEDPARSPSALGATTVRLHLYVPDVDDTYQQALSAGATSIAAPADAFWGDRYAMVRDPAGHIWSLATPLDDPSGDELRERAERWVQDTNPPP